MSKHHQKQRPEQDQRDDEQLAGDDSPELQVAATPPPAPPSNALSIELKELAYAPVLRKPYWAGVIEGCPVDQVMAGPVNFCRRTEMPSVTRSGEFEGIPIPGCTVFLSDKDVQRVLAAMQKLGIVSVVDKDGRVERASVERLQPGMEPAAKYCWLAPLAEGQSPAMGMPIPPPLLRS